MRTRCTSRPAHVVLALAPWACLGGCNAMLGIEPPRPGFLDAGSAGGLYEDDDSPVHAGSGEFEGAQGDGGATSSLPASDYAWPDWPMPNPELPGLSNPHAYSIRVEGVVTDAITRLEWQQEIDDTLRTWGEASEYCEELDVAGGGFRLPARIELLSLVDFTRANPSIDPVAFPDAPWDRFWSASPFAGTRSSVWLVNFEFGTGFSGQAHINEKHRVRCVR
jgi:hypothetical protein